jgi:hypothetical protein
MTTDSTEERGDDSPEEWGQYAFDPAEDETPPATRWTLGGLRTEIEQYESLRDDIVREIKAHGITFPDRPDWQDALMADYSACRSAPHDVAQLFFRLGLAMSSIFYLNDHLNALLVTRRHGAAGSEKAKEASRERRDAILTKFSELVANDPDARKLSISRLAARLETLFPPEAPGFSAGSIRRTLQLFEKDVLTIAAEPRFASLLPEGKLRAIADAKGHESGYSIETIRYVLES